jgi:hypothetical protein
MYNFIKQILCLFAGMFLMVACNHREELTSSAVGGEQFSKYWYGGSAEITSFELEQARYGELHKGEAVTIFVTEDFSLSKQVKLDFPEEAGNDAVKVMKLNMLKGFNTGCYPYSMMLSLQKPIDTSKYPHVLKISATSQEWCGHTFTQLNNRSGKYLARLYSYFETEGDKELQLPEVWTEDELWLQIRINPALLPSGNIELISGLLQQRLRHSKIEVNTAFASIDSLSPSPEWLQFSGGSASFSLLYKEQERSLSIYFVNSFPFQILGWEETYPDGFGEKKKLLTTRAKLKKTLLLDYWNHNSNADLFWRDTLGLMQ